MTASRGAILVRASNCHGYTAVANVQSSGLTPQGLGWLDPRGTPRRPKATGARQQVSILVRAFCAT